MNPIELAIVAAAFAPVILAASLRTSRTVLVFVGLTFIFLAANWLSEPWAAALKVAVVWTYVVLLLGFQHWLSGRSRSDSAFDRKLREIVEKARAAESPNASDTLAKRAAVVESLNALEPPSAAWARVVTLFRSYYQELLKPESVDQTGTDSELSNVRLEAYREQIQKAWEAVLRAPRQD